MILENSPATPNRFCTVCGAKMEKGNSRCPSCHAAGGNGDYQGFQKRGAGGVGYSKKADDPAFCKKKGTTRIVTLLFALMFSAALAVVILLVFKASIVVSAAVGGVLFIVIAVFVLIASRKKKSWEGVVEEKKKLGAMSREYQHHATYKYRIIFRTKDGKRKVWTDDHLYVRVFDYLQEGDRVRYIGGIGTKCAFEKYDKSGDEELMCVSCAALNDPRGTYCAVCGAPLMKGNPVFGDK